PPELALAAGARKQVAGDDDEVRPSSLDPIHRARDCRRAARGRAEVEIGEVRDPHPVELGRQARHLQRQHAKPDPARLEVAPGEPAGGYSTADGYRAETHTRRVESRGSWPIR